MTRTSKKVVTAAVEALNEAIDSDPRAEQLLNLNVEGLTPLDLINDILRSAAEGASIVAARETDGALVGFVPKRTSVKREEEPVVITGNTIVP